MPTARLFPLPWLILVTGRPSFAIDPYPRECYQATIPPGSHDAQGVATIVDERTIRVEHFTYDGGAPLVYFYLGAENTSSAFTNGIPIGPELDRAYHDEGITVQLPAGETLDGWNAISVWCETAKANFTSAAFPRATPDFDINGLVDAADLMHFESCHTGPSVGPPAAGCEEADLDGDGDVDGRDFGKLQRCLYFDTPALPDCAE